MQKRPLDLPCAVIGGGETTVKVSEDAGTGGPNQEFALGAAPGLDRIGSVVVVGIDTDGTDGPTDIAGGVVDDQTLARARETGIDLYGCLARHDVTPALRQMGDSIETGATGTNVNDLKFMLRSMRSYGTWSLINTASLATNTGDEGGLPPPCRESGNPLSLCPERLTRQAMPMISSMPWTWPPILGSTIEADVYELDGEAYDRDALIELYQQVAEKYPFVSMEDPLHEEDFEGFSLLTGGLDMQIVGDDLFVTNVDRLRQGVQKGAANAMLFKVNQIGTLTEALDAAEFAYRNSYGVQVSERSGETEDPIISDLVVALNSGQIKTGMPIRGERTSKHNRLLQIEEELGAAGGICWEELREAGLIISGKRIKVKAIDLAQS